MKYKPIYKMLRMALFTALLGGGFASCSNTETDVDDASAEVKVPLTISAATIESGTTARKASYDANSFEKGDVIGLYILSTSDYESPYDTAENSYNIPATYDGSQWILSQDVYLSEDGAAVYAYYPYNESYGNVFPNTRSDYSNILPISLMPVDNEQSDILTASHDPIWVDSTNPEVSLTFSHELTRITLSISLSSNVGDAYLSSASLYQTNGLLFSTALLGFAWEVFSLYENDIYLTDEWMTKTCNASLSSSTSYNVDFLIHPECSMKLTTTLTINGVDYALDITSNDWQSGYQYTYYLYGTAPEDEEEQISFEVVSSSYIEGWTDKGTIDEIDIEYEDTEEEEEDDADVEYVDGHAAVDLGLSVKWATCNVGAESPEDYGNYYAWGETETKDEYTTSNSVTYQVGMDDFSGNAEYDAATANWGGSWRMPTYSEIYELKNDCTWTWTTQNSVKGYLVTGTNGNSIFLPAAGYFTGSLLYYTGSYGRYWSSTPNESNTDYAYYLLFRSSGWNVYDYSRYYGHSLRPVTD